MGHQPSLSSTRPASRERRSEDVSQVARSLAYMTSLVTTLVGRMDRVEQAQSRNGSSASGRRTTTATSARMETPMGGTPEAGQVGWVDLNNLEQRVAQMSVAAPLSHPSQERPLATLDSIFAGTFSSDDSETARLRAAQADGQMRGIPGALLGPLAEPLGPVILGGNACGSALMSFPDSVGPALSPGPLPGSTLEGPLQAPSLQVMSQGSSTSAMQLAGMPQGSSTSAMQLSGMPQGSSTSGNAAFRNAAGIFDFSNAAFRNAAGIFDFSNTAFRNATGIFDFSNAACRNAAGIFDFSLAAFRNAAGTFVDYATSRKCRRSL